MPVVDRPSFVRACRAATPDTLTAFVAALYDARGWTVERGEQTVVLTDGEGNRQRIAVQPAAGSRCDEDADIVVVPTDERDDWRGTVVDYETLHQQLSYAIDRSTAQALLTDYFGLVSERTATETPEASPSAGSATTADTETNLQPAKADRRGTVSERLRQVLVVAILVGVIATGVAGQQVSGPPASTESPVTNTTGTETQTATGTAVSTASAGSGQSGETEPRSEPAPLDTSGRAPVSEELLVTQPAGVGVNGSVDAAVVARAHHERLRNTSYVLQVSTRLLDGDTVVSARTETIRRTNGTVETSATTVGAESPQPRLLPVQGGPRVSAGQQTKLTGAALVERYMTLTGATVTQQWTADRRIEYRLVLQETGHPEVGSLDGTVLVTGDGLVRFAQWSFEGRDDSDREVVITMRVSPVGQTTVTAAE